LQGFSALHGLSLCQWETEALVFLTYSDVMYLPYIRP
jgi:hypothetical protein